MEDEFQAVAPGIPVRDLQVQLRRVQIQETPVVENGKVVIIRPGEVDPNNNRWNRPFRVKMVHFLVLMALAANPTRDVYQLWINREEGWASNDIPLLTTDKGALRLQVWLGTLPNPAKHAEQVLLRMEWITEYIPAEEFTRWFLLKARGSPEIDQRGVHERSRRCLLCGSHVLGFPIDNHDFTNCIFRRIPAIPRLKFIAVNHRGFCSFCGQWSTTHTNERCIPKPCRCTAVDHQTCQDLCVRFGAPVMSIQEQDQHAFEAIEEHYTRCEALRVNNVSEYWCPGDAPSRTTRNLFIARRNDGQHIVLRGWAKFVERFFNRWIPPKTAYRSRTVYSGLITPEESSAQVNSYLLFPPEEIDRIQLYGMVLDQLRFNHFWNRNRRGNQPILTLPEDIGIRRTLREELPPMPPVIPVVIPHHMRPPVNNAAQIRNLLEPVMEQVHQLVRNGPRAQPPIAGPPVELPEEHGEGEVENIQDQNIDRPESPDVRPGQRRQVQVSDEEDNVSLDDPEPHSDHEQDAEEQGAPGEQPNGEGNGIPQDQEFGRNFMWFHFERNEEMVHELVELQQEQALNHQTNRRVRIHPRTNQVTTPVETLDEIAERRIPHFLPAIQCRIGFLIHSLTGSWNPPAYPEGRYSIEELQEYIALLQGAHRFLGSLGDIGYGLPARITNCDRLIRDPYQLHLLALPDLETYHWMYHDAFLFAEEHWLPVFQEIQRDGCQCTRLPEI
ncbi:hypothetical protein CAEBREN_09805 [Caenorhabditis brenneri]|uniref:Uncharacterized protein n=1 Tax=Caenorhabditis brenneri TaxID=135651 RepID=G0PJJ4_CAEBE|nr:hypothetical protein CAEBREN_09805 [Caenorhabditis brenneri]